MNKAHYAWWISVHLKDMAELPNRHSVVATELMMVNLLFIRPDRYSWVSLLIRYMNRIMPVSKEMEELLALQITQVLCSVG